MSTSTTATSSIDPSPSPPSALSSLTAAAVMSTSSSAVAQPAVGSAGASTGGVVLNGHAQHVAQQHVVHPSLANGTSLNTTSHSNSPSSISSKSNNPNQLVPSSHSSVSSIKYGTLVPNRVFVGGISSTTTEADLHKLFSAFGNVRATKIISDRGGCSKGYGFVTFETEEEAKKLQDEADNIILKERKLNIAPAIKKQQPYPRTYEMGQPVLNGALYYHNGIPYTYQNGAAIFHTADAAVALSAQQAALAATSPTPAAAAAAAAAAPYMFAQQAAALFPLAAANNSPGTNGSQQQYAAAAYQAAALQQQQQQAVAAAAQAATQQNSNGTTGSSTSTPPTSGAANWNRYLAQQPPQTTSASAAAVQATATPAANGQMAFAQPAAVLSSPSTPLTEVAWTNSSLLTPPVLDFSAAVTAAASGGSVATGGNFFATHYGYYSQGYSPAPYSATADSTEWTEMPVLLEENSPDDKSKPVNQDNKSGLDNLVYNGDIPITPQHQSLTMSPLMPWTPPLTANGSLDFSAGWTMSPVLTVDGQPNLYPAFDMSKVKMDLDATRSKPLDGGATSLPSQVTRLQNSSSPGFKKGRSSSSSCTAKPCLQQPGDPTTSSNSGKDNRKPANKLWPAASTNLTYRRHSSSTSSLNNSSSSKRYSKRLSSSQSHHMNHSGYPDFAISTLHKFDAGYRRFGQHLRSGHGEDRTRESCR